MLRYYHWKVHGGSGGGRGWQKGSTDHNNLKTERPLRQNLFLQPLFVSSLLACSARLCYVNLFYRTVVWCQYSSMPTPASLGRTVQSPWGPGGTPTMVRYHLKIQMSVFNCQDWKVQHRLYYYKWRKWEFAQALKKSLLSQNIKLPKICAFVRCKKVVQSPKICNSVINLLGI